MTKTKEKNKEKSQRTEMNTGERQTKRDGSK
jgi:hypothetical protein